MKFPKFIHKTNSEVRTLQIQIIWYIQCILSISFCTTSPPSQFRMSKTRYICSTSSFSKYPLQIITSDHRKTCSKLEKLFQVLSLACHICSNYCVILSQQQNQSCWSWWLWSKSTVLRCWWSLLIKMLTISVHISITAVSSKTRPRWFWCCWSLSTVLSPLSPLNKTKFPVQRITCFLQLPFVKVFARALFKVIYIVEGQNLEWLKSQCITMLVVFQQPFFYRQVEKYSTFSWDSTKQKILESY